MKTIIFLFLFSFSTISSVHAMSGNEWLSACDSDSAKTYNRGFNDGLCHGFLHGIYEYHNHMQHLKIIPKSLCIPKTVTRGQLVKVAKKWLKEHPEELHLPVSFSYYKIMEGVFPCRSQ